MTGFSQLAFFKTRATSVEFFFAPLIIVLLLCAPVSAGGGKVGDSDLSARKLRVDPYEKINAAFNREEIGEADRAFLQAQYFFDQQNLPAEFRHQASEIDGLAQVRCGLEAVKRMGERYGEFTPAQRSLATAFAARPVLDTSVVSPGGFFRLHFDTTGVESVPTADVDLNGRPDYIDRAAEYLDSAWNHYHVTLSYFLPPDDGVAGGDDKYDVYFLSIFGYGVTIFDGDGPQVWDDRMSYILLHKDFNGFAPNPDPDGSQLGALKATCVHEYFHAVQLAYDGSDELWMYESGATWQEQALHPDTKDNYQFLPLFYNDPDTFLTTSTGSRMYGAFVWPGFLAQRYSQSVIREVWQEARTANGVQAIDQALALHGSSTAEEFSTFTTWNLFTSDRADPAYFPKGAEYPAVALDSALPDVPFSINAPGEQPDGLGAIYMPLDLAAQPPGLLKVQFQGGAFVSWGLNIYLKDSLGAYDVYELGTGPSRDTSFVQFNYTAWDSLFVAPHVTSQWQNDNDFTLSTIVAPFGDSDGSDGVSIGDVTYMIAYIFSGGAEPQFNLLMGDADCSGHISVTDVTYLIAHIFGGGPAPCPPQ